MTWSSILTNWGQDKIAAILADDNFAYNFNEVCSWGSNQQYSSIGSDYGLVPTRRQAIIWTNDGWIFYAYMRQSAPMS